jgi:hypothetical protein
MAPYPNPSYDPDWEKRYDHHHAEREKWAKEKDIRGPKFGWDSLMYREAHDAWKFHHQECLEAFQSQHRTVQDYAAWQLKYFGSSPETDIVLVPDFDQFATMEEVTDAWTREYDRRRRDRYQRENSLPVKQPAGLEAFREISRINLSWRSFTNEQLGDESSYALYDQLNCLVVYDRVGDHHHFCISQKLGDVSPGIINRFEHIATVLAHECIELAFPGSMKVIRERRHRSVFQYFLMRKIAQLARSMHFYEHWPATAAPESFSLVGLTWTDARFVDPLWGMINFNSIPEVIRHAPDILAKDGATSAGRGGIQRANTPCDSGILAD